MGSGGGITGYSAAGSGEVDYIWSGGDEMTGEDRLRDKWWRMFRIEYMRRYREKRKARGMCLHCVKPTVEGKVLCEGCLKSSRDRSRDYYYWLKEQGMCTHCGSNRPRDGKLTCEECSQKKK